MTSYSHSWHEKINLNIVTIHMKNSFQQIFTMFVTVYSLHIVRWFFHSPVHQLVTHLNSLVTYVTKGFTSQVNVLFHMTHYNVQLWGYTQTIFSMKKQLLLLFINQYINDVTNHCSQICGLPWHVLVLIWWNHCLIEKLEINPGKFLF